MGISSALFSGVSGLNTLGNSMSVIGDNIANVNTIGFKSSRSTFETVLAQSISGASGTSQVGRGVALSAVDANFSQGSFESTSEPTDMAIGGKGFFMVRSDETGRLFTRAGHFRFDEEGFLVNPADLRVQGWDLEPTSPEITGGIVDIQINATSSSPNATSEIDIAANLDSAADILETGSFVEGEQDSANGFIFVNGANDLLSLNGGATTVSLITEGGLVENSVYSGAEVANAIEQALNTVLPGNSVVYNSTAGTTPNTFEITTPGLGYTIDALGTASDVLGITLVLGVVGAGTPSYTDASREYYVQTGVNDTFEITVDNNPITGQPVSVWIDGGNYTGGQLAAEMEEKINNALSSEGVSVDVRYDELTNPSERVFRITSSSRGTGSQIDIDPGTNNFIPTIRITEYDSIEEGSGFTTGGFTESADPVGSSFYMDGTLSDIVVTAGGTSFDLISEGGLITGNYYTGEEIATAIQTGMNSVVAGLSGTASYSEDTGTFTIVNTAAAGNDFVIDWGASSAAQLLGFDIGTTETVLSDNGQVNSYDSTAFNIVAPVNNTMQITVDNNTFTDAPVSVIFDAGVYTGDLLATHMETRINETLSDSGEPGRVDVNYNTVTGIFSFESRTLGSEGSIELNGAAATSNPIVLNTLGITDRTINSGTGFQLEEPDDTSNYSTSLSVFDSLGNSHTLSFYFRKAVETDNSATWEWFAYVPAGDTTDGLDPEIQARGTLNFTNAGILLGQSDVEYLTTSGDGFDFGGGAVAGQEVDIDFGFLSQTNVTTQFRAPSSTIYQTQDGYDAGFLQDVAVDPDGVITGNYSNGQVLYLARVALANFTNPWGLSREGGNSYAETRASGQPTTATPGSSGTGKLSPNSLEQSNVDLSREFVDMIIQQRGFQANSKVITTTDQMLAELINLKR